MKPTHNAISPEGQKTFSPTFDTFGFFARSMGDLQLLADVFSLQDDEPPKDVPLSEAAVALIRSPFWSREGPGTVAAMDRAATVLRDSGVKVDEVSFPGEIGDSETLKRLQKVIMSCEARVAFLREYRVDKTKLDPEIRGLVENDAKYTNREMAQALDKYASMRPIIDNLAAKYSAVITPSAVDEAPLGLDDMGSAAFNIIWTVSCPLPDASRYLTECPQGFHTPVINIPAFTGAHNMPIGISLVAGRFCDQQLLRIGKMLSETLMEGGDWRARFDGVN